MAYTKQDIKDCLEDYIYDKGVIINHLPKMDYKDKIIEDWLEFEDIWEISKITRKTPTQIVSILKNCGIY